MCKEKTEFTKDDLMKDYLAFINCKTSNPIIDQNKYVSWLESRIISEENRKIIEDINMEIQSKVKEEMEHKCSCHGNCGC